MEKRFHLFVRKHAGGVSAQVLVHPHLATMADDLATARADLAHVLEKLLVRGELWDRPAFFEDAHLRKVDLHIRAVQRGRLLEVPMRFSVLVHGAGRGAARRAGAGAPRVGPTGASGRAAARGPVHVQVPRLGVDGDLDDVADVDAYVEELIRHELYLAPLGRLLALAYVGSEQLDHLTVQARPRDPAPRARPALAAVVASAMPSGLAEACRRLDDDAASGHLDHAFQREAELARLIEIVGARTRASVLLVGPSSVGKTTLVHELAYRARDPGSPAAGLELYATSAGRIVAGMRYLGEWQGRVERMLLELRKRRAVLHLGGLGELVALGDRDGADLGRMLLPAIEAGEVSVILEATAEEVARAERSHGALVAALRQLPLPPLDPERAALALAQVAARVGRARKVRFAEGALDRALDLSERFGDGPLPGGAAALLREAATAAAAARPAGSADAHPRGVGGAAGAVAPARARADAASTPLLDADAITTAFSTRTGYRRDLIDPARALDPVEVRAFFAGRVLGQDQATELFTELVLMLKTGLADPRRPLGSFLLLGPTGVGKTESALALAGFLFGDDHRLVRFDMSEYAAPGSAARLLSSGGGADAGARGLAGRVAAQPFGVVLLDEIEKADASVHDLLLQVLGEGRLTDPRGHTVSLRNTIIVLTSNLGADGAGRSLGFSSAQADPGAADGHYRSAAAAYFRPELLNRFGAVVPYRPLGPDVVAQLARRGLDHALGREGLTQRGVRVRYDDAVVARLAELGFDARLGARPLVRAIEAHVVAPLARLLAAAGAHPPAELRLVVADGVIVVEPGP